MFQVLEKDGRMQPVYSKDDLDYMMRKGWRKVATDATPAQVVAPNLPKRKYTRRAKR